MAKRVFKTTKTLSNVGATYRKWGEWDEGDVLIGKYIKSKTDKYGKPNWLLKVEDAQFLKHKLAKTLIGQVIGLNSSGGLDRAMEEVEEGQLVQITYNGMEEMAGGPFKGKDKHLIDVQLVVEEGDEDEDEEEEEEEDEDDL